MIGTLSRRVAASLLLLLLVLTLTFFIIRLAPGEPLAMYETHWISTEQVENLRQLYGLDKPLITQYFSWLGRVVQGDWGTSFSHQRPALDVVVDALPKTFLLGIICLLCQYGAGLILGVLAAQKAGAWPDHWIRILSLVLYSVPAFWVGLMLILVVHLHWNLLPAGGAQSVDYSSLSAPQKVADMARHLVLPVLTLTLATSGRVARFVRNSLLEVLTADYIRTARAKGLSRTRVIWLHGLRNAVVPVVQLFGLSLPGLLNGILVVEVVFAWPGLGRVMFNACLARDYPVILTATALSAVLVIAGNLLADLLHTAIDPRVRHA